MRIEVISQSIIGGKTTICVGDVLNKALANPQCYRFRFAVAYMRVSGLRLLYDALLALHQRQGIIAGAVGIDDGVTTIEALQLLASLSSDSTIVHTVSDYIYHPKLYMIDTDQSALIIVGSANLTRDGLYRNVELATAVTLDLTSSLDHDVYNSYDIFLGELLNPKNSNVQPINNTTLKWLTEITVCEDGIETPDSPLREMAQNKKTRSSLKEFFPALPVPRTPQISQEHEASPRVAVDEKPHILSHEPPQVFSKKKANRPLLDPVLSGTQTSHDISSNIMNMINKEIIPTSQKNWHSIADYIRDKGPLSVQQVRKDLGIHKTGSIMQSLERAGILQKVGRGLYVAVEDKKKQSTPQK